MYYLATLRVLLVSSFCLLIPMAWDTPVGAQDIGELAKETAPEAQEDWYYGTETETVATKSIAQQKSQKRAEQRMARLEAMRWYGFSASRPTASGMPFTSSYSPSWTRPGGRPFGWYTGGMPSVVINRGYHGYRF